MSVLVRSFRTLREFSAFLLIGTVAALLWANLDVEGYQAFIDENPIFQEGSWMANVLKHGEPITFHFLVNDVFMVLFFGIAGKEVSESFLPGGALSSLKKAAMPAIATLGGVVGPVAVFFALNALLASPADITSAWAVPTATDIAYCWLFAGLIFGRAHPAVTFLLVLAVLDDMIGMLIIATVYTPEVHVEWLGLLAAAIVICEVMRRMGVKTFWPYVIIGGTLSWFGLHNTGVHAALALVPIVPFMPHAERDRGMFEDVEGRGDTMNDFEHFFAPIVDVGLLTFGLANAGVVLSGESLMGSATWVIFLSLLVGKTVGISLFSWIGSKAGLTLPEPMTLKQVPVLGCVAGIGFTVALFVTTVAYGTLPAEMQQLWAEVHVTDMLKLGALLSFAAGPIAWLMAIALKVEKIHANPADAGHGHH